MSENQQFPLFIKRFIIRLKRIKVEITFILVSVILLALLLEVYRQMKKPDASEARIELEVSKQVERENEIKVVTAYLHKLAIDFNLGKKPSLNYLSYWKALDTARKQGITTDNVAGVWRKEYKEKGEMPPRLPASHHIKTLERKLEGTRGLFAK